MNRDYEPMFEPVELGPVTVPNRLYQPPHGNAYGLGEKQTDFRAEKAKGGFGLIIQEYSTVHESSDATPVDSGFIHEDGTIPPQREMVNAIHAHGAKAMVELWHAGHTTPNRSTRKPPLSSSQVPAVATQTTPKKMEQEDIDEIIQAFGAATDRARRAGYDGVELHAAHGYLFSQFMSPFYNKRDDEYGGSLENRMRFFRETIDACRGAAGDEMAVGARYTINEMVEGGLTEEDEGLEIMRRINDDLDFWDVDIGVKHTIDDMISPSRRHDKNYQMPFIKRAREVVDVPVGGVGRIIDPDDAVRLIEEGYVDLIGMARQSISDPHWPRKVEEDEIDQIRECIGCNVCVSQSRQGIPLICTQNPTVGEEARWPPEEYEETEDPKGILVVGGGPAGLEFARVAGERGHIVHLNERDRELGGRVNFEAGLPDLGEWKRVRDWRETELDRLETVSVHTGPRAHMDYEDVRTYGAETVVIATGAEWDPRGFSSATHEPIDGWEHDHVFTPEEVIAEGISGESVLIFDQDGYNVPAGIAQHLVQEDNDVTFVTNRTHAFDKTLHTFEQRTIYENLFESGVEFVSHTHLEEIQDDRVTAYNVHSEDRTTFEVDSVVLTTMRRSNDDLYKALKADLDGLVAETEIEDLHAIGDCVAPHRIADAVYHGHELGREV